MVVKLLRGALTVDDYHRLGELGILCEDDRVELLDGQVVPMSPIGPAHAGCVNRLNRLLSQALGDSATLGVQNPAILDEHSEPQPDVTVLRFRPDGYAARHPRPADVLLLVEVSVSSLDYDRDIKIPLYARAGVPEVWIVDLNCGSIEVYRDPAGDDYASHSTATRGQTITPVKLPPASLPVSEILG